MRTIILFIASLFLLSCNDDQTSNEAINENIRFEYEQHGSILTDEQLEKMNKIREIVQEYGLNPTYTPEKFNEETKFFLSLSVAEIRERIKEIAYTKEISRRTSRITKRWEPILTPSSVRQQEKDSLFRAYNAEIKQMQKEVRKEFGYE
ncbi:MAG: hypothetical protein ACOCW4_03475 [bacterium]